MVLRKQLGPSGIEIPEIGLGTWHYSGGPEPLRCGFEAGAWFIDTAESYGSETVVAEAIAGVRDRVFLATKVSRQNLRRSSLLEAADRSLRQLRTNHIDLYQIHQPNDDIPIEETMGAMEELVDAGKIRFIGVSNFSVRQLQQAQAALQRHSIVSNQVRYNLIDRTIEADLLPYCAANKITVIAYSPLGRELQRLRDADPSGVLQQVAAKTGRSVPQIALNWCLRQREVVVIPKGSSITHVRDLCGGSGWRLEPPELRLLDERIRFRRRSRWELALRRAVPRGFGKVLQPIVRRLPSGIRRRLQ
ncbi:MAG TPA: aldo/keto reductase [Verrucomicrobiota bacterium]|nr:aldo/keto reductase [Verrucomicrobiales bacterium]HRI15528.1 aldo/keto reductase [Verrucomicrobiota bacterium]